LVSFAHAVTEALVQVDVDLLHTTSHRLPCETLALIWHDPCRVDRAERTKLTAEPETDCARDCNLGLQSKLALMRWCWHTHHVLVGKRSF
jgi:hypothetical protein